MKNFLFSISAALLHLSSFAQWTEQTSNTNFNLNDVFFTSDSVGMAVGDNGRLVKTVDGGTNWVESNPFSGCNSYAIHFATADSGWVAGTCGIYFTSNGGLNWTLQTSGNGKVLNDIFFYNSLEGWVVGNEMTILSTIDGGTNWSIDTLTSSVPGNPLLAVYFRDEHNGWIGGGEKLHFTTDGGLNWIPGSSLLIDWIYSMDFGDNYAGVAAGMAGSSTYTFDWGSNWNFDGSITANYKPIYGVDFSSPDSVYSVGKDGLIYFSNNSGTSWTPQTSGVTTNLNAVNFPSSNVGYAVGDAGTIIKRGGSYSGLSEDYTVYPNPATDLVNIPLHTIGEDVGIALQNSMGTHIPMDIKSNGDNLEINIETLPTGVYILKITTDQGTKISRRLLKL
ncbi:YCF48-related protein [Fluviicola taffensis]|uniref:T9SS type A sorting domain-containing protein n=1 Tax=Fluviicola taffensis TaxID=191579 RepID=UPI003137E044